MEALLSPAWLVLLLLARVAERLDGDRAKGRWYTYHHVYTMFGRCWKSLEPTLTLLPYLKYFKKVKLKLAYLVSGTADACLPCLS